MTAVEAFASMAAQFCSWVEAAPVSPDDELAVARRLAARLYAGALDLPLEESRAEGEVEVEVEGTTIERRAIHARFGVLPINMYAAVDPLECPGAEPTVGDVADDLADTYFDVLRGLRLYRSGLPAAAAWQWAFSFRAHWGAHVLGALSALHASSAKSRVAR